MTFTLKSIESCKWSDIGTISSRLLYLSTILVKKKFNFNYARTSNRKRNRLLTFLSFVFVEFPVHSFLLALLATMTAKATAA